MARKKAGFAKKVASGAGTVAAVAGVVAAGAAMADKEIRGDLIEGVKDGFNTIKDKAGDVPEKTSSVMHQIAKGKKKRSR